MSEQLQRAARPRELLQGPVAPDADDSAARLAAARDEFERIFAAADAILDDIRLANNERFLEQVRQQGGQ